MYPPITCYTCGTSLPQWQAFNTLRKDYYEKYLAKTKQESVTPNIVPFICGPEVELASVLDKLGITNDCCRAHIISWVLFEGLYYDAY